MCAEQRRCSRGEPSVGDPKAIRAAQGYAPSGKDWVVDLDVTKLFDHANWDIHRNIYVGGQAAGERVKKPVQEWIEKHL